MPALIGVRARARSACPLLAISVYELTPAQPSVALSLANNIWRNFLDAAASSQVIVLAHCLAYGLKANIDVLQLPLRAGVAAEIRGALDR